MNLKNPVTLTRSYWLAVEIRYPTSLMVAGMSSCEVLGLTQLASGDLVFPCSTQRHDKTCIVDNVPCGGLKKS